MDELDFNVATSSGEENLRAWYNVRRASGLERLVIGFTDSNNLDALRQDGIIISNDLWASNAKEGW